MYLILLSVSTVETSRKSSYSAPLKISIKTEIDKAENRAIVWIKDNGLGMSEEIKNKVFDRFAFILTFN